MQQLKKRTIKRFMDLLNIQSLAPFLADEFVDSCDVDFDIDNYLSYINKSRGKIGDLSKYLICRLHDSQVIEIMNQNNILTIKLNDFSTHVFADAIKDRYNLPISHDELIFPINIEFRGDLFVNYFNVDDSGNLREIDPVSLDVYLNEQITRIDENRIEIVFNFWKEKSHNDKGECIILIISANNVSVKEIQDKSWEVIFKHKYIEHYNYFKMQFENGKYLSDYNECLNLINEIEKQIIA